MYSREELEKLVQQMTFDANNQVDVLRGQASKIYEEVGRKINPDGTTNKPIDNQLLNQIMLAKAILDSLPREIDEAKKHLALCNSLYEFVLSLTDISLQLKEKHKLKSAEILEKEKQNPLFQETYLNKIMIAHYRLGLFYVENQDQHKAQKYFMKTLAELCNLPDKYKNEEYFNYIYECYNQLCLVTNKLSPQYSLIQFAKYFFAPKLILYSDFIAKLNTFNNSEAPTSFFSAMHVFLYLVKVNNVDLFPQSGIKKEIRTKNTLGQILFDSVYKKAAMKSSFKPMHEAIKENESAHKQHAVLFANKFLDREDRLKSTRRFTI